MIRLLLFAFLAVFILTGTNFGKNLVAEHDLLKESLGFTEKWFGKNDLQEKNQSWNEHHLATETPQDVEIPRNNSDVSTLAKEETITKVLEEFSISELVALVDQVKSGISEEEFSEIKEVVKERFSNEEFEALLELGKKEFHQFFSSLGDD